MKTSHLVAIATAAIVTASCGSSAHPNAGGDAAIGTGDAATGDGSPGDADMMMTMMPPVVGHIAYMTPCGAGYTRIGTLYGAEVCASPLPRTAVITTGETCTHGERVGDYRLGQYRSVCAFEGHLGYGQFGNGCPSDLTDLEPSGNGSVNCGRAGVQIFWTLAGSCPAGWTDAGPGTGVTRLCRRDHAGSLVQMSGDCPSGWERVDNYCASLTDVVASMVEGACPAGWQRIGADACLQN